MAGPSVEDRLKQVRLKVAEACAQAGREASSVRVLAVSKLQANEKILAARAAGQRDFAENYVQEAAAKVDELQSQNLTWHFIGRIQTNKIKQLVGRFEVIHSIDRLSVVEALEKANTAAERVQNVFLQFNAAGEESKAGGTDSAVRELAQYVLSSCPHLRLLGLMVMPPLFDDPEQARPFFRAARILLQELKAAATNAQRAAHPMNELSMGTSHDYVVAISEGATWVRIGTDIFGPREET